MSHKVERDFTAHGLRCVVIACDFGHRCGYVGITKSHPLFGVGYNEQADCLTKEYMESQKIGKKSPIILLTVQCGADNEDSIRRSPDLAFDVHGGLTYSDGTKDYPVESDGLWWFGFDCGHCDDAKDPSIMDEKHLKLERKYGFHRDGVIRTEEYVAEECERLAEQLASFATQEVA